MSMSGFNRLLPTRTGNMGTIFIESCKDGKLPATGVPYFGGSVWEPIPGTDKAYLQLFHKKQPDLNWENPEVREEVYQNINGWLDKGWPVSS